MKVLFLVLLFSFCSKSNSSFQFHLLEVLKSNYRTPVYLFSYPGREIHESKKRIVLDYIIKKIENSKELIEIYAYSFNHPEIIEALKSARNRGVKITFLLDSEKNYQELDDANFTYRIWKGSGLHHIKAILFDRNSIFLGTGNFSKYGLTHDWNGYIDVPLENFEYHSLQAELEIKKADFLVKASKFQFLFSPQNGILIQDKIFQEIEKAKEKILILSFDHYEPILSHVLKKASSRGVQIQVVQNRPLDEEGKYLTQELFFGSSQVYEDGNTDRIFQENSSFPEAGLLHHKTILIDDKILLTGSYNFSLSARDKNRELFLFTSEQTAIKEFTKEFYRIQSRSYPQTMNFLHSSFILKNEISSLDFPKTCYEKNLPSGVWEVGAGIFFSYIYFSKSKPCFEYSKRAEISSGLASFSMEEKEMQDVWSLWNFYPRYGNKLYFQNPNPESLNREWGKLKIEEGALYNYTIEFEEILQNIKIYIPNYGFVENIEKLSNTQIKFSIQKKVSEFLILWSSKNQAFFSCGRKEKSSKKLDFLIGKLLLNSSSLEKKDCVSF